LHIRILPGQLYRIPSNLTNAIAYASPFKGWVNDTSISGATVASGIYVNGHFVTIGQSGLDSINHYQGVAYFTGVNFPNSTTVTAAYSVKEFNVSITDQNEWKLLFETKFVSSNEFNQVQSGLALDTKTVPAVFIRNKGQDSRPFALGGYDNSILSMRAIVVADNQFGRIAACNILKNMNYRPVPLITATPFDWAGRFTGVNYNYDQLAIDSSVTNWILGVRGIDVPQEGDYENIIKSVGRVDFDISTVLRHTY
jgi:hypothetical protein